MIAQTSQNPDNSNTDNSDPEMNIPDEEADTTVSETASTQKTQKCKLRGILTINGFDNMRFLMCQKESGFHHGLKELEKVNLYTLKPFPYSRHLHEQEEWC